MFETTLLDMYAKCGALVKAQEVFDKLLERNVITWNALVAGYAQHDLGHEVLKHFEKMQSEGISPNTVTLVCILTACGSLGFVDTRSGRTNTCQAEKKVKEVLKHLFAVDDAYIPRLKVCHRRI